MKKWSKSSPKLNSFSLSRPSRCQDSQDLILVTGFLLSFGDNVSVGSQLSLFSSSGLRLRRRGAQTVCEESDGQLISLPLSSLFSYHDAAYACDMVKVKSQ